jgi:tRNA(adenine34) deaminase
MQLAIEEARAAQDAGEVPVGCVIVRDSDVIASAGNRTLRDRDPTAHAELLAIRQAAAACGSERLTDCDLYVTLEPCAMCAGAIMHARVARLVFGAADPKTGACGSVIDLFGDARLNHHAAVTSGVMAEECAALLREFFAAKRKLG